MDQTDAKLPTKDSHSLKKMMTASCTLITSPYRVTSQQEFDSVDVNLGRDVVLDVVPVRGDEASCPTTSRIHRRIHMNLPGSICVPNR